MTLVNVKEAQFSNEIAGSDKPKDSPPEADASSWSDFAQSTTFHGVKYCFDSQGAMWRKLLWSTIVIGCVAVFSIQVTMRVIDYFKYETLTDVEQMYEQEIQFPAVTICNQNTFKISQVKDFGIYDFIDDFYQDEDSVDPIAYQVDRLDTGVFQYNTAHKLTDIIERCEWLGEECAADSFVETLTPKGVCYTFNSGKGNDKDPYNITAAGKDGMLKLILNVEKYENMRGPNNDAGIVILLHDQKDELLADVTDIAVAPGKHYLINVNQIQREQLPPPYGECNEDSDISRADCSQTCQETAKEEKCKCKAPHMLNSTADVCSLEKYLYCFEQSLTDGTIVDDMKSCKNNCTTPCHMTMYENEVSFAELSPYNIERMIIQENARKDILMSKFESANEVRQRVVKSISELDTELINDLVREVKQATATLKNALDTLVLTNLFSKTYPLKDVIDLDLRKLDYSIALQYYDFVETELKVSDIEAEYGFLDDMVLLESDGTSKLVTALTICKDRGNISADLFNDFNVAPNDTTPFRYGLDTVIAASADNSSFYTVKAWIEAAQQENPTTYVPADWRSTVNSIISDETNCDTSLAYLVDGLRTGAWRTTYANDVLFGLTSNYETMINQTFYKTGSTPSKFPEHATCLTSLDTLEQYFSLPRLILSSTIDVQDIYGLINITSAAVLHSVRYGDAVTNDDFSDAKKCNWIQNYNDLVVIVDYLEKMERVQDEIDKLEGFSPQLDIIGQEILLFLEGQLKNVTDVTQLYLSENVTKLELSSSFYDFTFIQAFDEFKVHLSDYKRKASEMDSAFYIAWFLTKWVFEESIGHFNTIKVPVMNETFVLGLNTSAQADPVLLQRFIEAETTDEKMAVYYDITLQVYDDMLGKYLTNSTKNVDDALRSLQKAITTLQTPLTEYYDSLRWGAGVLADNFLQVDIFYTELKYTRITQGEVFGLLSLLGEIGGFLGLLLGASMMTVCEFLDFLAGRLHYLKKKKQVAAEENQVQKVDPRQEREDKNKVSRRRRQPPVYHDEIPTSWA